MTNWVNYTVASLHDRRATLKRNKENWQQHHQQLRRKQQQRQQEGFQAHEQQGKLAQELAELQQQPAEVQLPQQGRLDTYNSSPDRHHHQSGASSSRQLHFGDSESDTSEGQPLTAPEPNAKQSSGKLSARAFGIGSAKSSAAEEDGELSDSSTAKSDLSLSSAVDNESDEYYEQQRREIIETMGLPTSFTGGTGCYDNDSKVTESTEDDSDVNCVGDETTQFHHKRGPEYWGEKAREWTQHQQCPHSLVESESACNMQLVWDQKQNICYYYSFSS